MAYLEQLADWVERTHLQCDRAEWERRCDEFVDSLCEVCKDGESYIVVSAPERGTAEYAEWWERAMAECQWLHNNGNLAPCGEANFGWYFEILAREVGVTSLFYGSDWYQ